MLDHFVGLRDTMVEMKTLRFGDPPRLLVHIGDTNGLPPRKSPLLRRVTSGFSNLVWQISADVNEIVRL